MNKKLIASACALFCISASASSLKSFAAVSNPPQDACQKYFNQGMEAVLNGDKATLRKLYDYDMLDGIANREAVAKSLNELMQKVHQEARALYRKGEVAKAAERLEMTFDFTAYVADKVDHDSNSPDRTPEYWIAGWTLPALHMPKDTYISALNDYGAYLIKINQDAEAARVLQAVISAEPQREIAYLNLANALWHLGRKDEALPYFEKYKEIRAQEDKVAASLHKPPQAMLHVSCSLRSLPLPGLSPLNRLSLMTLLHPPKARVDLGPYLSTMQKEVKANWQPPVGEKSQSATLQFDVYRSGKVGNLVVEKSANKLYDLAAIKAVHKSGLPPLPQDAPDSISLNFVFSYNVVNKLDKEDLAIKQWLTKLAQSKSAENHAGLAEAYEDDGDYVCARQQLLLAIAKERGPQQKRKEEMLKDIDLQIAEINRQVAELGKEPAKPNQRLGIPQAALNNQGATALNNNDYELAIQKFSQALDIDPGYKMARNNLGMVFNNRGIRQRSDKIRALRDFHRALLLRTDDTASEKNISTSIKTLIKGHDSYELRRQIAENLALQHDDVGAIAEYRRALEIKNDPKIREALQQITDRVMNSAYNDSSFISEQK